MITKVRALCISTVHMNDTGPIAFLEGKIYDGTKQSETRYSLINERGLDHGASKLWFDQHFKSLPVSLNMVCIKSYKKSDMELFSKDRTYGVYQDGECLKMTINQGKKIEINPSLLHEYFMDI